VVSESVDIEQAERRHADDDRDDPDENGNKDAKDDGSSDQNDRSNNPIIDGVDDEVDKIDGSTREIITDLERILLRGHVPQTSRQMGRLRPCDPAHANDAWTGVGANDRTNVGHDHGACAIKTSELSRHCCRIGAGVAMNDGQALKRRAGCRRDHEVVQ